MRPIRQGMPTNRGRYAIVGLATGHDWRTLPLRALFDHRETTGLDRMRDGVPCSMSPLATRPGSSRTGIGEEELTWSEGLIVGPW